MSFGKKGFILVLLFMLVACSGSQNSSSKNNHFTGMVPLYYPHKGETVKSGKVLLVWGMDSEHRGKVKYDLYFQKNNPQPELYASGLTTTSKEINSLEVGKYYFWKVVAVNNRGEQLSSETYYFKVASDNDTPPSRPVLLSPKPGSIVYKLPVEFKWNRSIDPDGDLVTYTILIGTNPDSLHPLFSNYAGLAYFTNLERDKGYYWRVVADDGKGGRTESSIYYFKLYKFPFPLKPLYPVGMTSPYPGDYINNLSRVNIYWNKVTSPNGGIVNYYVSLDTEPDLSNARRYGPLSSNHILVHLESNTNYFLKITAVDQYGARSKSHLQWFFNKYASDSFNGRFKYIFMGGSFSSYYLQYRNLGCGITSNGEVWCWGDNSVFKLLTGVIDYSVFDNGFVGTNWIYERIFYPPRRILLPPWKKYKKIGISIGFVAFNSRAMGAAVSEDGELWFWDNRNYPFVAAPTIVKDPSGNKWKDFAIRSNNHICAIDTQGYLYCWGDNNEKEVGDPDNQSWVDTPYQISVAGNSHWKSVTVGYLFSCAISADSPMNMYCWGNNDWGQLGIDAKGNYASPVLIKEEAEWKKVSAGMDSICALDVNGSLWCWGRNSEGEVGIGRSYGDRIATPEKVQVDGVSSWKDFYMGFRSVCAVDQNSSLWCWGDNALGGSNDGYAIIMTTGTAYFRPVKVMNKFDLTNVSIGATTGCGLKNGDLWCWGDRGNFYFGDNFFFYLYKYYTSEDNTEGIFPSYLHYPQVVQNPYGRKWKCLNISNVSSCGIDESDHLWCWGINNDGFLGTGDTSNKDYPAEVKGDIKWKSVTFSESFNDLGGDHLGFYNWACGLSIDNKLFCWGKNDQGQLGTGDTNNRSTPSEVINSSGTSWVEVAAGNDHACAIDENGTLWCWGDNDKGQVGQSDTGSNYLQPVSFTAGKMKWTDVTAGYKFTCAINESGDTYCWGSNGHYILGENSPSVSSSPIKINTPEPFVKLSAELDSICGLSNKGNIYCWGRNDYGQLGRGKTSGDVLDIARIYTDSHPRFISLHCIGYSCSAIDSSGHGWFWGRQFVQVQNQFRGESSEYTNIPKPMIESVVPVENKGFVGSEYHKCYLGDDNNIYCWGSVDFGRQDYFLPLGVGVRYRFKPTKVNFYFR